MSHVLRTGPLGALVDETQRAVVAFTTLLQGLDAAALDVPRQASGELTSLRQVAEHVRMAAHIYEQMQRRAFGLDEAAWNEPPADPAALLDDLKEIPARAWAVLEDKADWDDDQLTGVILQGSWGQSYDLEQLLEHALAHVWRHVRQVEGWLARDVDHARRAEPVAAGGGRISGEAAAEAYLASAEWYDRLYRFKDYAGEAGRLVEIIRSRHPGARTLLDAACGTGRHLEQLCGEFTCEGFDLAPAQLAEARRRLPGLPLHLADLRTLELGRGFDVVCCLFGAIGYMTTLEELEQACARLAAHLEPGGLLLLEPWIAPEDWRPEGVHALFIDEPGLKLARIHANATRGRCSHLDMHHLVGTAAGVRHVLESHELLLSTHAEQAAALEKAGLAAEFDAQGLNGRGLWIARQS